MVNSLTKMNCNYSFLTNIAQYLTLCSSKAKNCFISEIYEARGSKRAITRLFSTKLTFKKGQFKVMTQSYVDHAVILLYSAFGLPIEALSCVQVWSS